MKKTSPLFNKRIVKNQKRAGPTKKSALKDDGKNLLEKFENNKVDFRGKLGSDTVDYNAHRYKEEFGNKELGNSKEQTLQNKKKTMQRKLSRKIQNEKIENEKIQKEKVQENETTATSPRGEENVKEASFSAMDKPSLDEKEEEDISGEDVAESQKESMECQGLEKKKRLQKKQVQSRQEAFNGGMKKEESVSRVSDLRKKRGSDSKDYRYKADPPDLKDRKFHRHETLKDRKMQSKSFRELRFLGLAQASALTKDYLSYGARENVGVEGAMKGAGAAETLAYLQAEKKRKQKKSPYSLKEEQKGRMLQSKLEYSWKMEDLTKTESYKNASSIKRFQKRKRMKAQIYEKNHARLVDRIRESLSFTIQKKREVIIRQAKTAVLLAVGFIVFFVAMSSFASTAVGTVKSTGDTVMTTTYLSERTVLENMDQSFSDMEQQLQDYLDNIADNEPGYDNYIVNMDGEIGHDVHELLSYITSRKGPVKDVSEVQGLLKDLFKAMYKIEYDVDTEIRRDREGRSYEYRTLIVNLRKTEMDRVVRKVFEGSPDNLVHYEGLLSTHGNMGDYFGTGSANLDEIIENPDFENPGIQFDTPTVQALFGEAEKHIGKKYVFGANGPDNFDCSSFVCWSYTHSGVKNIPRTTAWGLYSHYCNPVSPAEAQPGDLIFFQGTYNSGTPVTHVGIYAGHGMMLHAGNPIKYTSINTSYWKKHFYSFGRLR